MSISSETFLVKALQHHPQLIKCSLGDRLAFRAPISIVFLYRKQICKDLIINSLTTVLNDFPVFAGILTKNADDLYIDCNNQGAQVAIVHFNESLFNSLSDLQKLDTEKFVDAIHPSKALKQGRPVLTIKLNYYTDGMVIGYCWSHSIGDMGTFMEFLKALSFFAQGKGYEPGLIPDDRTGYLEKWLQKKKITLNKNKKCKLKILSFADILRFIKQICSPKQSVYLYFTEKEILVLKNAISEKTGLPLSRNDVLCAHLLNHVTRSRSDSEGNFHASFVVNMRSRLGLPSNLLGNYVDLISIKLDNPHMADISATKINLAVKNYLEEQFQHYETEDFISKKEAIKKIDRIIPEKMLPQYKNLTISNWSNFGAYSIDFGIIAPHLILPVGRSPIPWLSCIVEGFDNKGLLVSLVLPTKVAKRLTSPDMLEQIHQYRPHFESAYGL